MKKVLMKAIVPLGAIASVSFPLITAISCGDSGRDFGRKYSFEGIWASLKNYEDVKVINWVDGDTLTIEHSNHTRDNIRIQSIDTPELHVKDDSGNWVLTEGTEYEWALKATEFGKQEIKDGSTVRLVTHPGELSHGRMVGSIFYGDEFKESYSVNIIKRGLALPLLPNVLYLKMLRESSVLHYIGVPIADAYNYAKSNGLGIFSIGEENVSKVHGISIPVQAFYEPNNKKTVYNYMDIDYWKE